MGCQDSAASPLLRYHLIQLLCCLKTPDAIAGPRVLHLKRTMHTANPSTEPPKTARTSSANGMSTPLPLRIWKWLTRVDTDDPVRHMLNHGFAAVLVVLTLIGMILAPVLIASGEPAGWAILLILPLHLLCWWFNRRGNVNGELVYVLWVAIPLALGSIPSGFAERFLMVGLVHLGALTTFLMIGIMILSWSLRASITGNATYRQVNDALESDSTQRRRTENALRESEELYRMLTDNSNDLIYLVDVEGKIVYASPSAHRVLGRDIARLVGTPAFASVHPDDLATVQKDFALAMAGQRAFATFRIQHADGSWRWLEGWASLAHYRGRPHVLGVGRDVTERKQVEEAYHLLVEHSLQGLVIIQDERIVFANRAAADIVGYSVEELLAFSAEDLYKLGHPDDRALLQQRRRDRQAGRPVPVRYETRFQRKSGETVWIDLSGVRIEYNGKPAAQITSVDITERKRAEEALRAGEERLHLALRAGRISTFERDARTGQVRRSANAAEIIGLGAEGTGREYMQAVHPDDRERLTTLHARLSPTNSEYTTEYRLVRPDEAVVWLEEKAHATFTPQGDLDRLTGVVMDVTERKKAESARREAEEKYRGIFENAVEGIYQTTPSGRFLTVNPAMARMAGFDSPDEMIAAVTDIGAQFYADRKRREEFTRLLAEQGVVNAFEIEIRRRNGSVAWLSENARAVYDTGGAVLYYEGSAEDITSRKQAEDSRRQSLELLLGVIEGTTDGIYVKDREGWYVMANAAAAHLIGKPVADVIGRNEAELFTPETYEAIRERDRQIMASGHPQTFEETVLTAAGVQRVFFTTKAPWFDFQGNAIGVIGIARDVTDLKRLEVRVHHAQKMEAIGLLAGGIAHDFNNLLTVINGYASVLLTSLAQTDPVRDFAQQMADAGERAATLTRQLLAFSRKQVLKPVVLDLNRVVAGTERLLRRVIREDVKLITRLEPTLQLVKADPGQLEQVIMNLAVNARDAMPEGGRLVISTDNVILNGQAPADVLPGPHVRLTVEDTGCGISAEALPHIFEPFFTTKGVGKGTGLGLATVFGIVKQSGGHIEVASQIGRGTLFTIHLPAVTDGERTPAPGAAPRELPRATETVLLVEDEEGVRNLAHRVLEQGGYQVLTAQHGRDALAVSRQHMGPIHLLLTDVIMPEMGGPELARLLMQERRSLKVLYMSGYTDSHHTSPLPGENLLSKPFAPAALAQAVREALSEETRPAVNV